LQYWQFFSAVHAAAGLGLIILLWWLYFDYVDIYIMGKLKGSGRPYIYLHFFIYIGIAMVGVGIEYSILSQISTLAALANLLMVTGLVLFLIPLTIIQGIYFAEARKRTFLMPGILFLLFIVALYVYELQEKTFYFPVILFGAVFIYLLIQRKRCAALQRAELGRPATL
jgi:low temperature requirement protein LtrA